MKAMIILTCLIFSMSAWADTHPEDDDGLILNLPAVRIHESNVSRAWTHHEVIPAFATGNSEATRENAIRRFQESGLRRCMSKVSDARRSARRDQILSGNLDANPIVVTVSPALTVNAVAGTKHYAILCSYTVGE